MSIKDFAESVAWVHTDGVLEGAAKEWRVVLHYTECPNRVFESHTIKGDPDFKILFRCSVNDEICSEENCLINWEGK